ncbi:hypothetical protein BR93DRAFT_925747 [Coniochaeta sp. PMI_546]|nr:hypothetical protein BR93DRAFT_925747 [Coniochaeta sp. PMI_546]
MSSTSSGFPLLEAKSPTPIAELHPDLPDQTSRAVTGEVTLVWPYNSATGSLAFLLADPDVRLRRNKGQVRVQLLGSSAKAVTDIRLGGGDTVALALDGVDWVKDNSVVRVPGSRVDWQLQFSEKLILQARIGDQRELKEVNVDHPERDMPPPAATLTQPAAEDSQTAAAPTSPGPTIPIINPITMEMEEYPSPAFVKRARLSYGALFEGGDDSFEADGGVKGKGRKRTRFGRESSSWRYTSQSPSPTPEAEPKTPPQTAVPAVEVDGSKFSQPKPPMTDEGCQTMEIDAVPTQRETPVVEALPGNEARRDNQQTSPTMDQQSHALGGQDDGQTRNSLVSNQAESDRLSSPSKAAASPSKFSSNTLFGSFATSESGYDRPRFGRAPPAEGVEGLGIANQVRFGFSHTPQTAHTEQSRPQAEHPRQPQLLPHSAPAPQRAREEHPEPHLEPSEPSKYADMETYVDQAEQEMETEPQYAYNGQDLNPPASESFGGGLFDIATQAQEYNPVERGHFGADALDEGTRITTDGYAIHNDEINVDKVPPGFASFSGGRDKEIGDEDLEDEDEEQPYISGEDFVENDELEDDLDDEVALDDRDDAEYGPEGEIIEQGDYDQREYNIPEDDQDELSEEEHENELHAMAQDNDPGVIDEDELYNRVVDSQSDDDEEGSDNADDDQGSYDEEEEGFDEDDDQGSFDEEEGSTEGSYSDGSERFYDNTSQTWVSRGQAHIQPAASAAASASKGPVVIDLLSDSEDDADEPPVQPVKQPEQLPVKAQEEPVPESSEPLTQDPTPTRQNLDAGDQHDAVLEPSPAPEPSLGQNERARRKSSGSHLYGEHNEEPSDDSDMGLHLPTTPPPVGREASAGASAGKRAEPISHANVKDDVTGVINHDGLESSAIPSFNGAAESRELGGDGKPAKAVSGGESGEEDSSVLDSADLHSAPKDQVQGTVPSEPSEESGILPGQSVRDSEDQDMTDAVTQRVSSPLRSLGDADETQAGSKSADITKRDVDEVERMFEKDEPDQDITMTDAQVGPTSTEGRTEAPNESASQSNTVIESHDARVTTGFEETDHRADDNSDDKNGLAQTAITSPPPSQSFASQVFTSSPGLEEDSGHLPTPMETQPSQAFSPQAPTSDMAQISASSAGEPKDVPESVMETTAGMHAHVEQQTALPAKEDEGDTSKLDVDMADAVAEDADAPSPVVERPSTLAHDHGIEDEMDIENQIQAQLQVEIVRTTVQEGQDQLTVVQETRRVSVSHVGGRDISGAEANPMLNQDADQSVEDIPVEPASLDDAIQEELMLQDTVENELASEFGEEGGTAEAGDDDDVDDDDEMEDLAEDVAEEEIDNEAGDAGDELLQEESTESEVPQVGPAQEETTLDDALEGQPAPEVGAEQHGPPQLESEETAQSTIAVLPDDDEVVLVGEADVPQPKSTIAVVPEEGDLVTLSEGNAPEQSEAKDAHRVPANATHQKPKQDLEVLIRPQTRSRRARGQESQSEEAVPQDDVSVPETTKELSPDVSKAPRRTTGGSKRGTRAPKETRDPSIELAKASIQKRGAGKHRLEPVALEPRRTRQRSTSLQGTASSQPTAPSEVGEEEDSSVAMAKAALGSPSKKGAERSSPVELPSRADFLRRLRITLAEFTPLKSLRHHKKGHPHVLAVVACDPPEPLRTKHRDFHTTVMVTDASVAPDQVVEVQFSELHKAYLPAVKQGDTMVLKNFEIVSLPGREFALKQRDEESSWAVYDADYEVPGGRGGPDFEIQPAVKDYLHDLRVWYNDLDVLDREKLATAVTKLAETAHGESVSG